MREKNTGNISRFGFRLEKAGVHTSRTMMLEDLQLLLSYISNPDSTKNDYIKAIIEDNCLGKRSGKSRKLAASHLVYLYSLDSSLAVFRSLHYFWNRDFEAQPILALLCAYGRDALRESLEKYIDKHYLGRLSEATLKSTAQNLNATWTKSGHLSGKVKKVRSRAKATPGSVAYALFLGYLMGIRGESLFNSEYASLLDCSQDQAFEMAEDASRRGWIIFKRVGTIVEVQFPKMLTAKERAWIND
jgi:hypothetical protein